MRPETKKRRNFPRFLFYDSPLHKHFDCLMGLNSFDDQFQNMGFLVEGKDVDVLAVHRDGVLPGSSSKVKGSWSMTSKSIASTFPLFAMMISYSMSELSNT